MGFKPGGIPFRNDSQQTIPAYGVMRVTGVVVVQGLPVLTVKQQDASFHRSYLLNGNMDIPAPSGLQSAAYGTAQDGRYPAMGLCDTSTLPSGQDNPDYGDHWGPQANSWKLAYGVEGFYCLGGPYPSSNNDGSGESGGSQNQRILVRPYELANVVVKLTETLNRGNSATGTLQQSSTTDDKLTYQDTGITSVTVFDGFLQSGDQLGSGTLVFCAQLLDGDKLLAVQTNACPATGGS